MERRTKAIILIALGAVALILGVVWLAFPLFLQFRPPAEQPPTLPTSTQPTTPTPGTPTPVLNLPTDRNDPAEKERQAQERLKQFAMKFVARAGTYGSADGYAGLLDAKVDAALEVRNYLDQERARLQKERPTSGPSWGQTAKPIAPQITSPLPVLDKQTAELTVQTQITVTTEGRADVTYKNAVVTMAILEGGWKVTRIEWKPVE